MKRFVAFTLFLLPVLAFAQETTTDAEATGETAAPSYEEQCMEKFGLTEEKLARGGSFTYILRRCVGDFERADRQAERERKIVEEREKDLQRIRDSLKKRGTGTRSAPQRGIQQKEEKAKLTQNKKSHLDIRAQKRQRMNELRKRAREENQKPATE